MNDVTGKTIKSYEPREYLGTGRVGTVYRAFDMALDREVAIKIILPQFTSQPDFIRRFEQEARIIASLEHPHITPIYNFWRDADEACIVTRLLRGGNLRDALKHGAFSVETAAIFLDQVAAALHTAHRKAIVHRDVKPENILFDEDGSAYLTDFGIALDVNKPILGTQPENAVSPPDYLAPEQIRGEPVTFMADIYALGIVLYEVLSGEHPFPDQSEVQRLYKQLNDLLPPLSNLPPDIADAVNAVLQQATAKNPSARYTDTLAFAAAFREAARLNNLHTKHSIVETLTLREQEVFQRLIEGKSNSQIAQELYLTVATVKGYNTQIFAKLHVRSRVQAIVRGRELHLISSQTIPDKLRPDGNTPPVMLEPSNPYKGLLAFKPEDSQDFFGREKLIQTLLDRMADVKSNHVAVSAMHSHGEPHFARFLAIVGPSGSGKSSLVKAGLIPALWRGDLLELDHWYVAEMIPGARPLDNLEIALTKLAPRYTSNLPEQLLRDHYGLVRATQLILPNDGRELVLVIDQFEEIFTLVQNEAVRTQFINLLAAAVVDPQSRVRIVITLRADFFDRPLYYPEFGEMVRSRMLTILPLSAEELERAIVGPAERIDVSFEAGLVASIIADVNYQPGALPLLQFTLTELFEQRAGLLLTRKAYETIGGAVGALAKHADKLYQELNDANKETARQLFLRLVTLGEGVEDTRRRVLRTELMAITGNQGLIDDLIDDYAAYRLLSLDHDPASCAPTVEIAHEALIQHWGQMRVWLAESREDVRIQRQIMAASEEWLNAKRDPGFLATGGRLVQFESLAANTRLALSDNERAYLTASITERRRQDDEREVQQKRTMRLQRTVIGILATFLFSVMALLVFVFISRNDAVLQSRIAFSRQLAAQAVAELRNPIGNDEYAALLAIRALQEQYDPVADGALVEVAFRLPLTAFSGHTDTIYDAAFSPDGHYILSGSGDGTARLWDSTTGQLVRIFDSQSGEVYAVAFSPDGNYILTGHEDHTAKLWDANTGELIRTLDNHATEVYTVAFSPDGSYFITADATIHVWNTATGELIRLINENSTGRAVAFSPDGTIIAASIHDQATLWELDTGRLLQTFIGHSNAVYSVMFSPDGQYVLTGSIDNTAKLWETATGEEIYTLRGHSSSIRSVAFSPNGQYVLTGSSDRTMRLWETATGQEVHRFRAHLGRVWSVAFSPDGQTILSGSADSTVKLWAVVTDNEVGTFSGHHNEIFDVAYSPDGSAVLTASADGTARLWNVASRQTVFTLAGHDGIVYSVAFSPDGAYALTGISDFTAKLWETATGHEIRTFTGHNEAVLGVAFSPDGRYALTASGDGSAKLWDIATGQEVRSFSGHQVPLNGAAFSPNGEYVLTASDDSSLRVWESATGQEVQSFSSTETVYDGDFSLDGNFILAGYADGSVRLWDINTGQEIRRFNGANNSIYNVAFSPDGRYITASSADRTAIVWDFASGAIVRVLRGHRSAVWGIAFSPDSRYVLTGSLDQTANLWQVDYRDFVGSVCARLTRDFTSDERELVPITDQEATCSQLARSP